MLHSLTQKMAELDIELVEAPFDSSLMPKLTLHITLSIAMLVGTTFDIKQLYQSALMNCSRTRGHLAPQHRRTLACAMSTGKQYLLLLNSTYLKSY